MIVIVFIYIEHMFRLINTYAPCLVYLINPKYYIHIATKHIQVFGLTVSNPYSLIEFFEFSGEGRSRVEHFL